MGFDQWIQQNMGATFEEYQRMTPGQKRSYNKKHGGPPPRPEKQALPEKPGDLGPIAAAEWDRILFLLEKTRLLQLVDGQALSIYCKCIELEQQAYRALQEAGSLTYESRGAIIPRPEIAVAEKARAQAMRILEQFGCTPKSRDKIKMPPPAPATEGRIARLMKIK